MLSDITRIPNYASSLERLEHVRLEAACIEVESHVSSIM